MRCVNCGKYNNEGRLTREGEVCKYCGGGLVSDRQYNKLFIKKKKSKSADEKSFDKQIIGFLVIFIPMVIAIVVGLIFFSGIGVLTLYGLQSLGVAIGLLMYQQLEERNSFITGIAKATIVNIIILISVIVIAVTFLNSYQ